MINVSLPCDFLNVLKNEIQTPCFDEGANIEWGSVA